MKMILTLLAIHFSLFSFSQRNNQVFDQSMKLVTCNIDIRANLISASTFLELEFYNPNDREIEGRKLFTLAPGQLITAFQLMLNGKYRQGTIEEKWKATNVYNTIVGKRVDPAIIRWEYGSTYSLHIYPIAPRSTRSVTITLHEILPVKIDSVKYHLPAFTNDSCRNYALSIGIDDPKFDLRVIGPGAQNTFKKTANVQELHIVGENYPPAPIAFSMILNQPTVGITQDEKSSIFFAVRHHTTAPAKTSFEPSSLDVYWDISKSGQERNREKEVKFLQQLVRHHQIKRIKICTFNSRIIETRTFWLSTAGSSWQEFLRDQTYTGATQLSCINLAASTADAVLIFSDGINSVGRKMPKVEKKSVYCITSSPARNKENLLAITNGTGGKFIDLSTTKLVDAVAEMDNTQEWLLNVKAGGREGLIKQVLPLPITPYMFITGTVRAETDTVFLQFGSGRNISRIDTILLRAFSSNDSAHQRVKMLDDYADLKAQGNWEDILEFGLKEKIVSSSTAFLVLEKASDYVKYNIAPPADLEEECRQMNYVRRDTRWERRQQVQQSRFEVLSQVVNAYNLEQRSLDPTAPQILLDPQSFHRSIGNTEGATEQHLAPAPDFAGKTPGIVIRSTNSLSEVVVVGYATSLRANMTGAVTIVPGTQLLPGLNVEQSLQGRVAGLNVTGTNFAPGAAASVTIRGSSTLRGNSSPLFVIDGVPVAGDISQLVHPSEVRDIVVLKDIQAAALYGTRASNGAIVINTRKGYFNRYNYNYDNRKYRLADMPHVAYISEWNESLRGEKWLKYQELQAVHGHSAGFYLDMAAAFHKIGHKPQAMEILQDALEVGRGSLNTSFLVAVTLETWGQFSEAIEIYESLIDQYPNLIWLQRSLAWANYQLGCRKEAINILFAALTKDVGKHEGENLAIKVLILKEINLIRSLHPAEINTSLIPAELLQKVNMDLRIVVDGNSQLNEMSVREPGKAATAQSATKKDGLINGYRSQGWQTLEFACIKPVPGKYRVSTKYYNYGSEDPAMLRVVYFKEKNGSLQLVTEQVMMENQIGEIEIAETSW
ncbi:MAG: TonB-dependent receptor plug domain-containing protein [Ferruginibacter sp.]|nr:TonB-dependent receptor plug domain-containing protein [Ferruginibacter sp.]